MKWVKHIFLAVMVVIFMVPATGFIYTRHTCQQSEQAQIVLDHEYIFFTEIKETHCEMVPMEQNCCSGETEEPVSGIESEECCSNDSEYLKVEDEYTVPDKAQSFQFEITLTIALLPGHMQTFAESQTLTQHYSPRVFHPPTDLLRQHSALLL